MPPNVWTLKIISNFNEKSRQIFNLIFVLILSRTGQTDFSSQWFFKTSKAQHAKLPGRNAPNLQGATRQTSKLRPKGSNFQDDKFVCVGARLRPAWERTVNARDEQLGHFLGSVLVVLVNRDGRTPWLEGAEGGRA